MSPEEIDALDWEKQGGLIPAVVQDEDNGRVLMLGYMNRDAIDATLDTGHVTFWSRSKERLWTKGETSGNALAFVRMEADCDRDTLLVIARPSGPTCHAGTASCFKDAPANFLAELDVHIRERERDRPPGSYTADLFDSGTRRIAQKVGEEAVETALASVAEDDESLLGEAADLIFHLTVLLRSRGLSVHDAVKVLRNRHVARRQAANPSSMEP
ncbi:MAG: bifunctional phosphoribosyl-AMP cyclohydrolase/phosphoribosyl-ATP diphosphatase HisIE [Vicinamibacteria bacterium]|nr:bifunctional phosphoribosyl-AMP cyclohydrolase/phosphoribosyl-ATP diphosphatase HisIE [Vicinamibacteria bacterium]